MGFLNTILDVIFPAKCLLCGEVGTELCSVCLNEAPAAERESAKWIFPLYDYRHPGIKKSLWFFKYKGKRKLAGIFADGLYGKIAEELSELRTMENFVKPILVPIPLSAKRRRERGFNQAELICREILKINNLRGGLNLKLVENVLYKTKDTEHQARIKDRRERIKNMTGTFSVKNEELIKSRNVILIDDILTTGATLGEARKVLKQFGARKVIAFTIAH